MWDREALTSTGHIFVEDFVPNWRLVNLLCEMNRGNCRAKRNCSHQFSLKFFRAYFRGKFWIKATFPHVFGDLSNDFVFSGSMLSACRWLLVTRSFISTSKSQRF